ncbi:MAG: putative tRNA sulfurtransferase [Candidatus Micrarchaeota archaeon]|nr:MAG: putative tRNA sulfurtransferase [Candidatus Micrarchaeota archaeon]
MYNETVSVHFAEFWTKTEKKRDYYKRKLFNKIFELTKDIAYAELLYDRVIVKTDKPSDVIERLRYIPGISWLGRSLEVKTDLDAIVKTALDYINSSNERFRLNISRSEKSIPFTSKDIYDAIYSKARDRIDKGSSNVMKIRVMKDLTYITPNRILGIGGFPPDSNGSALVLFSGGIDSPVASYMAIKKGLKINYLHVHAFPSSDYIVDTKIFKLMKHLSRYNNRGRLFLASFKDFQRSVLLLKERKYETLLFKRFLYKLADRIAERYKIESLVTGESISQVSSQTISNLRTTEYGIDRLIIRPLIGLNKEEIIKMAREIGTYELSIEKYKDVCVFYYKHAATRSHIEKILDIERSIDLDAAVERAFNSIEVIDISSLTNS